MLQNEKINKVKIFISSKCDGKDLDDLKYGIMRKALALLLEETGLCEVFVFEEGTATSRSLNHSYMDPLADSDLVIIIIDNQDDVSEPTMGEINRAKALNKKCIYIFCDQRKREITELQAQIQTEKSAPRYDVVHEFSDIPKVAYKAAIEDIIAIYVSYCKGRVAYIQENDVEDNLKNEGIISSGNVVSNVSKEFMKRFRYTKYVVKNEAGLAWGRQPEKTEKDENCAKLFGQIVGCASTGQPDFEMIKRDIGELHIGRIRDLILMRYDAVSSYFNSDLQTCLKKLEKCIELCDKNNIPKWLMNDVAIDLRNIQMEIDRENDVIKTDTQGQNILNQDNEPLYYPVIDRITSDYYAEIVNHMFNNLVKPSDTINLGGVDYAIGKACDIFLVAYFYGSITHMVIIRKRLYEYLMTVSLETREHKTFLFTVKLLLMEHNEKSLEKFLNAYGENTNNFNELDIKYLLVGIEKQPLPVEALLARIYLFKHFGYYYSDEQFGKEEKFLAEKLKECIKNEYALNLLIKPMFEAVKENKYRFSSSKCLDIIYCLFRFEKRRYYDEAFKCLCNFCYDSLCVEEQCRLQLFLIDLLQDEEIRNNCNHIFEAAQTMRQNECIPHDKLDFAVKESNLRFYEDTYWLNVGEHDNNDYWKYTKRFVNMIESDANNNGKGGVYSYSACNPYKTIDNIIINGSARYNSTQMKIIVRSIHNVLFASNQTIEAKTDAMELLCILQGTHTKSRQIKKLSEEILIRWNEVVAAKKMFYENGYGRENLELNFIFLQLILGNANEMDLIHNIVKIQNGEIASMKIALRTMERLIDYKILPIDNKDESHSFIQFAVSSSYAENYEIRFWAMVVLTRLLNGSYRQLCLERLVEMIDEESYQNKVGMLSRLKSENLEDPKIKYIFDKGKSDAHYWVRRVAENVYKSAIKK